MHANVIRNLRNELSRVLFRSDASISGKINNNILRTMDVDECY